jgi:hypothetical protein
VIGRDRGDGGGDVAVQRVLERAAGDSEQQVDGDGVVTDVNRLDHPELGDRALDLRVVDARERLTDPLFGDGWHTAIVRGRSEAPRPRRGVIQLTQKLTIGCP